MKLPHSDYFLYIHVFKKRHDETRNFRAVAILWRRGRGPPLVDGQMATLVTAQSFGTLDLTQDEIAALANAHGHLPGVPAGVLAVRQDPPVNIVVPRVELLRHVVHDDGTPVLIPSTDALGYPVVDANGHPEFLTPQGNDLVVDLVQLKRRLLKIPSS